LLYLRRLIDSQVPVHSTLFVMVQRTKRCGAPSPAPEYIQVLPTIEKVPATAHETDNHDRSFLDTFTTTADDHGEGLLVGFRSNDRHENCAFPTTV
jgi:hypothetical protein